MKEAEAGKSEVKGHPQLFSKFGVQHGIHKTKQNNNNKAKQIVKAVEAGESRVQSQPQLHEGSG